MPTSVFKITSSVVLNTPSTEGDAIIGTQTDNGIDLLQYPLDLLRDKFPSLGDSVDAVVPFVGFYILLPTASQAVKDNETLDDKSSQSLIQLRGLSYAQEVNKELDIQGGKGFITGLNDGKDRLRIQRKVNVLQKMICLYMPETINNDLNASYNTLSVGNEIVKVGSVIDAVKAGIKMDTEKLKGALTNFAASLADDNGVLGAAGTLAKYVQAGKGVAINPLTEVFFENMQFRQFNFDFKFQPRNQQEAQEVRDIIQTFRMYMVPEISQDNVAGIFFTVPGFFQIKYYIQQSGSVSENENIPKISGCVLTGVQTDWAPDGLSLHKDGMPTAIRMQLNFTELEIMHRDRIKQGY